MSNQITITKAGRVTITATQPGDENYNAATSVDQSFCISPTKPAITIIDAATVSPTLTSSVSSGNQWFLNGNEIASATNSTLTVTTQGKYKVQAHADDCIGQFSDEVNIVITAIEKIEDLKISIYPNPVTDYFFISGIESTPQILIADLTGRTQTLSYEKYDEDYRIDMKEFSPGFYVLKVSDGQTTQALKIIKK
jgi:hypothetical protein